MWRRFKMFFILVLVLTSQAQNKVRQLREKLQQQNSYSSYYFNEVHRSECPDSQMCFVESKDHVDIEEDDVAIQNCCKNCACEPDCGKLGQVCSYPGNVHTTTDKNYVCIPNKINGRHKIKSIGFYMVAACDPSKVSKEEEIDGCERYGGTDIETSQPVHSLETNTIYRNMNCAICNGANETVKWSPALICEAGSVRRLRMPTYTDDVVRAIKGMEDCIIVFNPPDTASLENSLCFPEVRMDCGRTGNCTGFELKEACRDMTAYLYARGKINENRFCLICNSTLNYYYSSGCETDTRHHPVSMTEMLNFNRDTKFIKSNPDEDVECGEDSFYDSDRDVCREILCPAGMHKQNETCKALFEINSKSPISVEVHLIISNAFNVGRSLLNEYSSPVFSLLDSETNSRIGYDYFSNCGIDLFVKAIQREVVSIFGILTLQIKASNVQIWQETLDAIHTRLKQGLKFFVTATAETAVLANVSVSKFDPKFRREPTSRQKMFSDPIYGNHYLRYGEVIPITGEKCNVLPVVFILNHITFCNTVLLFPDEYRAFDNYVVVHRTSQILYDAEYAYETTKNGDVMLRVCYITMQQMYEHRNSVKKSAFIPDILSFTFSLLSTICLVFVVLIYAFLEVLRTKPGLNTMILAGHVAIAQVLFAFGMGETQNIYVCKLLGVAIHFTWLSATGWSLISCIYVFSLFYRVHAVTKFRPRIWVIGSLMICHVTAALLVSVNIVLSLASSGFKDIGYGGEFCYINNKVMITYTFAVPLGIVVIANCAFFTAVVCKIHRSKLSSQVLDVERNYLGVYARLSTLTGTTWALGFLYEWTQIAALEYLFIVFHGCHGVMFMAAFVYTPTVWRALRSKFLTDTVDQ